MAPPWINAKEGSSAARQRQRALQKGTLNEEATGPSVSCRLRLGCVLVSGDPDAPPAAVDSQTQERKISSV